MLDFKPTFFFFVREARADVVDTCQLVVRISGGAEPIADGLDSVVAHLQLTLRGDLVLGHVDALVLEHRAGAWNAVQTVEARKRHADKASVSDDRRSDRKAVTVDKGVSLAPLRRIVVTAAPIEGIGMDDDVARAAGDAECAVAATVNRGQAATQRTGPAIARHRFRDTVVARRHHAADGLRAVAQRCRPPNDLDLLSCIRIDGYSVIFR